MYAQSIIATPPVTRRATASRTQAPPPSFQPPNKGVRSRASLDLRDLESKPLPAPGPAQAYYWQEPSSPPPSNYKFAPKTPPKRNGSVSTPQIGKMQPMPPAGYNAQAPSTPAAENLGGRSISPPASKAPISRQDFPPHNGVNGARNRPANRMSMGESLQASSQTTQDRVLDLPPEFALFQEFGDTFSSPALNATQLPPPDTLKSTGQVPGSSQQRSSIYREGDKKILKPQPSIPRFASNNAQRTTSPPLPAPPSSMGVSTSHATMNGILASSYKDFSPPQGLPHTNVPNSTYDRAGNVIQHRPAAPQQLLGRSGTLSSSPPPLPAGAALPAPHPSLHLRSQDAPPAGMHFSPPFQQRPPELPPARDPLPHMGQSPSQPPAAAGALRKSPSMLSATAPMKGKPRIFAAMEMEEQDGGFEPGVAHGVQPPHLQPQQPQQQHYYQQPQSLPYQHQPNHVLTKQHMPAGDPGQQHQPHPAPVAGQGQPPHLLHHHHPHQQQQPQQQYPPELLPSAEVFHTPRSRIDSLPREALDHEAALEADPRPSAAGIYRAPSSSASASVHVLPGQPPDSMPRAPRSNSARSVARGGDEAPRQLASPQGTPRPRKLSKPRAQQDAASLHSLPNGSTATLPGTADGHIHQHNGHRALSKAHHGVAGSPHKQPATPLGSIVQLSDGGSAEVVGVPLDDDPFARVEGVKMLSPATPPLKEGSSKQHSKGSSRGNSSENVTDGLATKEAGSEESAAQVAEPEKPIVVAMPLTPVSPEDFRQWRRERKSSKAASIPAPAPIKMFPEDTTPREAFTLTKFVADPQLLSFLLAYLTFYDWCVLSSVSKEIRILFVRTPALREAIMHSYLKTVGYMRWAWDDKEPITLSLQDLSDYMRGVSTPTHEYARVAGMHVHSLTVHPNHRDASLTETVRALTASARAYNRVVLRLRAQAEKEASVHAAQTQAPLPPPSSTSSLVKAGNYSSSRPGTASRPPSRAPSPTTSMYSYSQQGNGHPPTSLYPAASSQTSLTFRSPLFRLRRAPLLRVFVPSPEGDWLSDKSILECEAELKRAGIMPLLRLGDVVWDVAVGDEGNVGRMVWDGSYLIDLDYTYSTIGDLPKYLPTLAFPPSYFHRVIRTGAGSTNPIVHVDISPWSEEIALNLQLLQDRVRTETPQGAYHNVVRWVHRSSFAIRAPRGGARHTAAARLPPSGRIAIPDSNGLFVDAGWYGTIVVETEGTNEALADLQDRCGPGAFPPRPRGANAATPAQIENRKVFRILREKSRPGEIWMKAVGVRERLL
ncbi:hypothetical protein HYPSUDRAFT_47657 [Hypholoma sublateritium FD-334 SS-4]|uniref:F-box domain-containing protein n=1 Tax=Hypholoma sublateritium (strain FD-334 SS-4) TaxID=945553 RepID=A0A0D2LZ05_HYPSF|nr:hypothetical protein HYPSUDRAFT_47657 [Hypholoma sublateritium FD-334 SS-4]